MSWSARVPAAVAGVGMVMLALTARPSMQAPAAATYTLLMTDGRHPLPVRSIGGTEMVSLEQLASRFDLTLAEDTLVGGLTITSRGQRIVLIPGQSFASVNGRVVSLAAQVQRDRDAWLVPLDFLSRALGPALGVRMDVRRDSRLIVVGDVRVPKISGRFEPQGPANGRLVIDVEPPTAHRVTREGRRLVVRFEAAALDASPITNLAPAFVAGARVDGTTFVVDLGPAVAGYSADDSADGTRITIDLLPPTPVAPPPAPARPTPATPVPPVDLSGAGTIRTVVIDPGHGGDDEGAHGPAGTKEKDLTLQMARRLKSAIETRMGLRVILTRENDENVPVDRRLAMANNNKADLFISLHANASVRPSVRGAQVLTLSLAEYQDRVATSSTSPNRVPLVSGGTRVIDAVPWDLAQVPFVDQSTALAAALVRQLTSHNVPLYAKPIVAEPLRPLVGANMPAVMLEMGFLTNAADESALKGALSGAILESLVATVGEVRRGLPGAGGHRP
jgi:N-acetylmuramoyl-L-alanine amidase